MQPEQRAACLLSLQFYIVEFYTAEF